jgi:hypothetical protein
VAAARHRREPPLRPRPRICRAAQPRHGRWPEGQRCRKRSVCGRPPTSVTQQDYTPCGKCMWQASTQIQCKQEYSLDVAGQQPLMEVDGWNGRFRAPNRTPKTAHFCELGSVSFPRAAAHPAFCYGLGTKYSFTASPSHASGRALYVYNAKVSTSTKAMELWSPLWALSIRLTSSSLQQFCGGQHLAAASSTFRIRGHIIKRTSAPSS